MIINNSTTKKKQKTFQLSISDKETKNGQPSASLLHDLNVVMKIRDAYSSLG